MPAVDIESKKRKRKHKSKKGEEAAEPEVQTNGVAAVEKPRKKSKKQHTPTPEPEVEEVVADASEDVEDEEEQEDEVQLSEELKAIAAKSKVAKTAEDGSEDDLDNGASGANAVALADLPGGTSMPGIEDAQRFDELKLSDRTMEAIKSMGFENMTEIQRKAIPPLLRYGHKFRNCKRY